MCKLAEKTKKSVWLAQDDACQLLNVKLKTLKEYCYRNYFTYKVKRLKNKNVFYILRDADFEKRIRKEVEYIIPREDLLFRNAENWAKEQARRYIEILDFTKDKKGKELEEYVAKWNVLYPDKQTSYSSIIKMRRRYKDKGIHGLLNRKGGISHTTVCDKYFEYFKSLYLIEGAPSSQTCWDSTLGFAMRTDHIKKEQFPSLSSFLRRIDRDIPRPI